VNGRGELLGINSVVLARESVITLPVVTVERILQELLDRGHIARAYLGLMMQEVSLPQEWRAAAGSEQEQGLLVMHVASEGPAKRAGVSLGDVVIGVDEKPVQGIRQLHHMLAQAKTGDVSSLRLLRGGSSVEAKVELGDRPRR
jgi:S1-C subfamily serine protease